MQNVEARVTDERDRTMLSHKHADARTIADPVGVRALSGRSDIGSFIVMDVMSAAARAEAAGQSIVHMEVGQPGTPAPRKARESAIAAIEGDRLGYTVALGLPALRERIAQHYAERYGVTIAPERVVITTGSSAGFVLSFLLLFEAGARVGLPSPGYPCYRQILKALDLEPVLIETGPTDRWMPTPEAIAAAADRDGGLAGVLLASPNNPTGTMLGTDRLKAICDVCRRRAIWFISDEIYHGLAYDMAEATALAFDDDAIVINSFSKYFSMTGWRIGWLVAPEDAVPALERLNQNLFIAAPAVSQHAALGAFAAIDELEANKRQYAANRATLLEGLPQVGISKILPADGAFYLYADVSEHTDDSLAFVKAMLAETGVAATPGLDFDEARGGRFVRLSYAGTAADMTACLERLAAWPRLKA